MAEAVKPAKKKSKKKHKTKTKTVQEEIVQEDSVIGEETTVIKEETNTEDAIEEPKIQEESNIESCTDKIVLDPGGQNTEKLIRVHPSEDVEDIEGSIGELVLDPGSTRNLIRVPVLSNVIETAEENPPISSDAIETTEGNLTVSSDIIEPAAENFTASNDIEQTSEPQPQIETESITDSVHTTGEETDNTKQGLIHDVKQNDDSGVTEKKNAGTIESKTEDDVVEENISTVEQLDNTEDTNYIEKADIVEKQTVESKDSIIQDSIVVRHSEQEKIVPSAPITTEDVTIETVDTSNVMDVRQKSDVIHRKIYPKLETIARDLEMKPLTDQQLKSLYYNPMLEQNDGIIDTFIEEAKETKHEFYELLMNYYRARSHFVNTEKDIQALRNDYIKQEELVWTTTTHSTKIKGQCADNQQVFETCNYEQAVYNKENCDEMNKILTFIRNQITDNMSLYAYSSQLSRLQVESYIHMLYSRSPSINDIPKNAPVTAYVANQRTPQLEGEVDQFRRCISVLFLFQRRPFNDVVFIKDTREWLSMLISSLLRVASLADHMFLLQHILRCPAGIQAWAIPFLQVAPPKLDLDQTSFGSHWLDHFLALLANILLPIRERESFLLPLKAVMTQSADKSQDNPWILVDSDGEEDEDPEHGWHKLNENDLVALLDQFPMDAMFRHVLMISEHNDEFLYDIHRTSEHGMLRLFAFSTSVIHLLGRGLQTFDQGRYRQFNKRLGRLVRHTVQFVTDHWLNFKDTLNIGQVATRNKLQLEYDQFFMKGTDCILSSQRLGSWQFMAEMPYTSVSIEMMWKLIWLLHYGDEHTENLTLDTCKYMLTDADSKQSFEDELIKMPASEAIYLLTTFANMARSRSFNDQEFIKAITLEVFDLSYISKHTREFCSKVGRELLSSISHVHPTVMSKLLCACKEAIDIVGKVAIYLFKELPLYVWQPNAADMETMRAWLIDSAISSPENQLVRMVLTRMNWGLDAKEDALALPLSIHRSVATMLVEAHCKHVSDRSMGSMLFEGMRQMASAVHKQPTEQQQFYSWIWDLVLKLRLHKNHQPQPVMGQSYPAVDSSPDLLGPGLHLVHKSVLEKNALGCYVAVMMSNVGQGTVSFLTEGLGHLEVLVNQYQYKPLIHILSCVVPMFYENSQYLVSNTKFQNVIKAILSADHTLSEKAKSIIFSVFPGAVTKLFTCMIQMQIHNASAPGLVSGVHVIQLWGKALFKLDTWRTDKNTLYILDQLMRASFKCKGGQEIVDALLFDTYKLMVESKKDQNVLSTVVSWIASSNTLPTFVDYNVAEFGWLTYQLLNAEARYEEETQLWFTVLRELQSGSSHNVEQAVKKSVINLKLDVSMPPLRLSIYRWAQEALDTDMEHPALPIFWQRFFHLYLGRPIVEAGLPSKACVGMKFFDTMATNSMLKRLKKRLKETADHHHKLSREVRMHEDSEADDTLLENIDYEGQEEFHERLFRLYQTFSFWLDEPRLHDPELYLPALPPQYEAEKLLTLFDNNKDPWTEYIDTDHIDYRQAQMVSEWVTVMCPSNQLSTLRRNSRMLDSDQLSATKRILVRLTHFSSSLPPPSLVPVKAPVPAINKHILMDKTGLVASLQSDFTVIVEYARLFSSHVSHHISLDCNYIELIPGLYRNTLVERKLHIPCKRSYVLGMGTSACSGPSLVNVQYEAKSENAIVRRKVDENRTEYKQLIIQCLMPPPQTICCAVVHVENSITELINAMKSSPDAYSISCYYEAGIVLFYHMASLVKDDTRFYPPSRQFFSSCIDILGQEFVRSNPSQSLPLLQAILEDASLAGLLSPHFTPNMNPELYVNMYTEIVQGAHMHDEDLAFMLLTKFDISRWLTDISPALSERSSLIHTIGTALSRYGANPTGKQLLLFEVYRGHLMKLLTWQFPDHYGDVLKLLLNGSSVQSTHEECWYDFLSCLGCKYNRLEGYNKANLAALIHAQDSLSTQQIVETIDWFSSFFTRLRMSNSDYASFGLYPRWRLYIRPLSNLLGFLCGGLILKTASAIVNQVSSSIEQDIHSVWEKIVSLYTPWIQPLDSGGQVLSPWVDSDVAIATDMVTMFTESVDFLQLQFQGFLLSYSDWAPLSLVLSYYANVIAKMRVQGHVMQVFHARLATLHWESFQPSQNSLRLMIQIHDKSPSLCFGFLGSIITQIRWSEVVQFHVTSQSPADVAILHSCMFQLFTQLSRESSVMDIENSQLPHLLQTAEGFVWSTLNAQSYSQTTHWFRHNCNPQCVLLERTASNALILRLFKTAAQFSPLTNPKESLSGDVAMKQVNYIHCLIYLLCLCTNETDINKEAYKRVIMNLLTEIEAVCGAIYEYEMQYDHSMNLLTEILNLLNNCNNNGSWLDWVSDILLQWIESSPHSVLIRPTISAACRSLASLQHMVAIIETCADSYFNSGFEQTEYGGWTYILTALKVPEITEKEFLEECVQHGGYHVLFAYTIQRLPLCQSLQQELVHVSDLIEWTSRIKPSAENEAKLFIWWHKTIVLLLRQADFGGNQSTLVRIIKTWLPSLHTLGEDKASSGFLGAIGLGRKSQLSLRFRLITRALCIFLTMQITNFSVRLDPNTTLHTSPPGKTKEDKLSHLESLKSNKQYAGLKEHIIYACDFIANANHCFRDAPRLLGELTRNLYPEKRYLESIYGV